MEGRHPGCDHPEIRSGWWPGLIGWTVATHARHYHRDWAFGQLFEAKVAREMAAFFDRYDACIDATLSCVDADGSPLACVTIDGSDPLLAAGMTHLRWFIVDERARGRGLGDRLMRQAMGFVDASGARGCYLTTFRGLDAARHLYERHGFRLVAEATAATWGRDVVEQRFERMTDLTASGQTSRFGTEPLCAGPRLLQISLRTDPEFRPKGDSCTACPDESRAAVGTSPTVPAEPNGRWQRDGAGRQEPGAAVGE
eukprot:gene20595-21267_t